MRQRSSMILHLHARHVVSRFGPHRQHVIFDVHFTGLFEHKRRLDLVAGGERLFQIDSMMWNEPGLSSTVSPGLISKPSLIGRILATPFSIFISCTSNLDATSEEPPISRSGVDPVFLIFI